MAAINYRQIAVQAAQRAGINPALFLRQINQESGFNPGAVSGAGAIGIAQIVPRFHPGVNPRDPVASLNYAAHWMGTLVRKYGNYAAALSVYNSGRPDAYKDPHFAGGQTYNYVKSILGAHSGAAAPPAPGVGQVPAGLPQSPSLAPPASHGFAGLLTSALHQGDAMLGLPSIALPKFTTPAAPPTGPVTLTPTAAPMSVAPTSAPTGGPSLAWLSHFAKPFGLTTTSTTGGKHAAGSYHYQKRAEDFGGDPASMARLAKFALAHPGDFKEMFYTGPGHPNFFISGGKVMPLSQLDRGLYLEHENHVHLAR